MYQKKEPDRFFNQENGKPAGTPASAVHSLMDAGEQILSLPENE